MTYYRRRGPHRVVAKLNSGETFGVGPGIICRTGDYLVIDCASKGRDEDAHVVPAHLFERDYEEDPDQSDPKAPEEESAHEAPKEEPQAPAPQTEPPHGEVPSPPPST